MIKKAGHIALILLLVVSTSGVSIYRHYCGSVLMKETIQLIPEPCCDGPCKCCHNESEHFRITDNFLGSTLTVSFKTYLTRLFDFSGFQQTMEVPGITPPSGTVRIQPVKPVPPNLLCAMDREAHLQVFRL